MFTFNHLIAKALLLVACAQFIAANTVGHNAEECPLICPALYAPLCATDGFIYKQFMNPCEMKMSNCQRGRNAATKPFAQADMDWCTTEFVDELFNHFDKLDLSRPDCLKACPMIYAPVCISNGKYRGTISNSCLMDTLNCVITKTDAAKLSPFKLLKEDSC